MSENCSAIRHSSVGASCNVAHLVWFGVCPRAFLTALYKQVKEVSSHQVSLVTTGELRAQVTFPTNLVRLSCRPTSGIQIKCKPGTAGRGGLHPETLQHCAGELPVGISGPSR